MTWAEESAEESAWQRTLRRELRNLAQALTGRLFEMGNQNWSQRVVIHSSGRYLEYQAIIHEMVRSGTQQVLLRAKPVGIEALLEALSGVIAALQALILWALAVLRAANLAMLVLPGA